MMRTKTLGALVGAAALLAGSACADLDVTNPNNPDIERALASPEDVKSLAEGTVVSWYQASTRLEPYAMFEITSDALTGNYGNFGMRFNNLEPRIPYGNNASGSDANVAYEPWNQNYGALGAANDVLLAFANGITLPGGEAENNKYRALALLTQAGSLTNLAWIFDQAFVVDETSDPETAPPVLAPYAEVAAAAMTKWDALIALTSGADETYAPLVLPLLGMETTSQVLNQIANTFAARTLVYNARNKAETEAVDWGRVLQYAEKGISGTGGVTGTEFDMTIDSDGNFWYAEKNLYTNYYSWIRVDMRLIHELDPSQPAKYTGTMPPAPTGGDKRLHTDIRYEGDFLGDPGRGIYMLSPYTHTRYEAHSYALGTAGETPVPYVLKAENDLIIAEALVRTGGDLGRAASLINTTRVGRGELAPVAASDSKDALLAAIAYERDIELLNTGGISFYDRRRIDGLQDGTLRHLPVPASQLEVMEMDVYTFGGVGQPDMQIAAPSGRLLDLHVAPRTRQRGPVAPRP